MINQIYLVSETLYNKRVFNYIEQKTTYDRNQIMNETQHDDAKW